MLKINMIPYFYIGIGLVAGEWKSQDYGQNQLRYSVPPPPPSPPPQFDQRQVYSAGAPEQPPRIPQARPCRRRNNVEPGAMLTDSGWVFLPRGQEPNFDQQTGDKPSHPQISPQSLSENKVSAADDKKQAGIQSPKSQYPDKIIEYVEKSSPPNPISQKRYIDANEHKITPDQVLNDNVQDTAIHTAKTGYPDATSLEREDSHEISKECGRNGDSDQALIYDNSETLKPPKEAREQTVRTLPECVQANRRSMQDEGDSRKFEASIPSSDLDKTDVEISFKPEANDDSKTNVMKSARMPNNNKIKPYLLNPAKNAGKWQSDTHVSLLENGKVCYACSTYFDPSCWTINATTTVKYCNKDNNACVSKMYKIDGKVILIRDCGHTCNEENQYDVGQRMTTCSMCHEDLCNGANALPGLTALLVTLIVSAVKFTS